MGLTAKAPETNSEIVGNDGADQSSGVTRFGFVDSVRGIAALLVFGEHLLEATGVVSPLPGGFSAEVVDFGQAGVFAFFLVSGFVIPLSLEKSGSLRGFVISRIFRLYPLYLFAFVLGSLTIFDHAKSGFAYSALVHVTFLQEFFLGPGMTVPGSWTLSLEVAWYFFFSLTFLLGLKKRIVEVCAFVCLPSAALIAYSFLAAYPLPFGRLGLFVSFLFGLVAFRRLEKRISVERFWLLIILLTSVSMAGVFVRFYWLVDHSKKYDFSFVDISSSWALGFAVFFGFYQFRNSRMPNLFFFRYLGRISYSIYLSHAFVILAVSKLGLNTPATILIVICLTFAVSHLTYNCIERPAIRVGHRLAGAYSVKSL